MPDRGVNVKYRGSKVGGNGAGPAILFRTYELWVLPTHLQPVEPKWIALELRTKLDESLRSLREAA